MCGIIYITLIFKVLFQIYMYVSNWDFYLCIIKKRKKCMLERECVRGREKKEKEKRFGGKIFINI